MIFGMTPTVLAGQIEFAPFDVAVILAVLWAACWGVAMPLRRGPTVDDVTGRWPAVSEGWGR